MSDESTASRSAIHQSLTRPLLLAGAERAPAIANWITAAAIFFGGGLHWYTVTISALLVTVGHWALVQAANFDPQLSLTAGDLCSQTPHQPNPLASRRWIHDQYRSHSPSKY